MPQTFEKLSNSSLRGRIAERIREAILDGTLAEGERLVERRLAQEFGASLSGVREALVELETDGFIAKLPNSATHVIRLTREDAEKTLSVRQVLEGFAVAEAARSASAGQMQELASLSAAAIEAASAGDVKRCLQLDLALHEMLWRIAGNEPMMAALRRIVLPFYTFFSIRMKESSAQDLLECAESNLTFLSAVYSKDPERAMEGLLYSLECWMAKTRPKQSTPATRERSEASGEVDLAAFSLVFSPARG